MTLMISQAVKSCVIAWLQYRHTVPLAIDYIASKYIIYALT